MTCFTRVGLLKDMIDLFGGIRFRYMDLYYVRGMRLLLDTCAETLETLWLYPSDPHGESLFLQSVQFLADNFTARSSLGDFDLSRNKSLRTLEITARSIDAILRGNSPGTPSNLLAHALSTITSPMFSEVVVFYREENSPGAVFCLQALWFPSVIYPSIHEMSQAERAREVSRHHERFELFHEMHKIRDFQLVLCVDVWDRVGGVLGKTVETVRGG